MENANRSTARAVADTAGGYVLATLEVGAPAQRVFRALASNDIVDWWVRPGVFDTREWKGDLSVGGHWEASGMARGREYTLEGEFLEIEAPRRLSHTWRLVGAAGPQTTVTYLLEEVDGGTRVTLRHSGFPAGESSINTSIGWETSLARLGEYLAR
ncbi:MAG TPA: SRPBCC family protein [Blastocatellia bacterium]|nr:SRPBCC family protein [Blastocatellia bacterium]